MILALIVKSLKKLQRDFLWDGWKGSLSYHLVSWDSFCKPKKEDGLGIKRMGLVNKVLLSKWL